MLCEPFYGGVDDQGTEEGRGFAVHRLQDLFGVTLIGGDGDAGDEGALPEVLIIDFGDRYIEFSSQAVFEAFYEVALVFKRVRIVEAKLESDDADRRHGLQ